jgi:hypothetical protein
LARVSFLFQFRASSPVTGHHLHWLLCWSLPDACKAQWSTGCDCEGRFYYYYSSFQVNSRPILQPPTSAHCHPVPPLARMALQLPAFTHSVTDQNVCRTDPATSGSKARRCDGVGACGGGCALFGHLIFSVCRKKVVDPRTRINKAGRPCTHIKFLCCCRRRRWLPGTWNPVQGKQIDKCNRILPIVYTVS